MSRALPASPFSRVGIEFAQIPIMKVSSFTALLLRPNNPLFAKSRALPRASCRRISTEAPEMDAFMEKLKNYEKIGVPKGAGTDSCDGFDLGRMRRLLHNLGNPQSKFKVRFM